MIITKENDIIRINDVTAKSPIDTMINIVSNIIAGIFKSPFADLSKILYIFLIIIFQINNTFNSESVKTFCF